MKKLLVIAFAALALSFNAKAQDEFYPGWHLDLMGGANYVTSNLWQINQFKHITPTGQIALEYDFSPVFGLRGTVSGPIGTYPINTTKGTSTIGKFNYLQGGLDAMIDIANIFSYKSTRFLSPYVFLGAAGNYRFKTDKADAYFGPGVRAGLGFNFRLSDAVKFVIELQDNALNNKFNTLDDDEIFAPGVLNIKRPFKWDDNFAALAGLKIDLSAGKRKAAAAAAAAAAAEAARLAAERAAAERAAAERAAAERAAAERAAAERAAAERAAAAAAAAQRPAPAPVAVTESVYFDLNKSILKSDQQSKIDHLVSVLRQNPSATVTISGYADKATGTAKRNMTLSEERANVVKKALTDAGIAANRITTEFYGDTQQVSSVPEMNRVAVCVTK